jgi:energy-coupling factor transport system substrate-specific component
MLAGPIAGLITGALSNLIWGRPASTRPIRLFSTWPVIGLLAGIFSRLGWGR